MSQKTLVPLSPLDSVSFETVWEKEDYFTEWLIEPDNLKILSDTVGIEILEPEIQDKIGDFRADIVAHDDNNNKIIIENQKTKTDHDHLGKALTYAAGKSANTIIWIATKTTEEHRAAIKWLNQNTNEKIVFFLLELKLWKIENSNTAIQFDIIEQPNNWVKIISKDGVRDIQLKRYEFWKRFQDYAFKETIFNNQFHRQSDTVENRLFYGIGSSKCNISINQLRRENKFSIRLWMRDNKNTFDSFYSNKEEIEKNLNDFSELKWNRLGDNSKESHIDIDIENVEFDNVDTEKELFDKIIQIMLKMKKVFKNYI